MDRITFGDTDGDTEAKLVSQLEGYIVGLHLPGIHLDDVEVVEADNQGFTCYLLDQGTGERRTLLAYRWDEIVSLHVY